MTTTTKFNRSQIFANAWKLVKEAKVTLSEALKAAWDLAKRASKPMFAISGLDQFNFTKAFKKSLGATVKPSGMPDFKYEMRSWGFVLYFTEAIKVGEAGYEVIGQTFAIKTQRVDCGCPTL
jgi:hypothetical protein